MSQPSELAYRCLSAALGRTILPGEQPVRGEDNDWDSLKQIELMFVVEDETGHVMTPEQLEFITDLVTLDKVLEDLRGSR